MGIARSEARETLYWIRLLGATGMVAPERLSEIRQEAEELAKILTSIVKKVKK